MVSTEFMRINCVQSVFGLVYLRSLSGSTVVFCYYMLGGDTVAPSGLYARLLPRIFSLVNFGLVIAEITGLICVPALYFYLSC